MEMLRPVRERRAALAADPGAVTALLAKGAEKARAIASATYQRAAEAIGLLSPGLSLRAGASGPGDPDAVGGADRRRPARRAPTGASLPAPPPPTRPGPPRPAGRHRRRTPGSSPGR